MLRLERLSCSWAINTCTATSFGSTRRPVGILRLMLPQEAIAAGAPMLPSQNSKDSVSVHSASTRLLTCCTHKVPQALSLQGCPTPLLTPAPPFISFRACLPPLSTIVLACASGPRDKNSSTAPYGGSPGYYDTGFLAYQFAINLYGHPALRCLCCNRCCCCCCCHGHRRYGRHGRRRRCYHVWQLPFLLHTDIIVVASIVTVTVAITVEILLVYVSVLVTTFVADVGIDT